MTTWLQHVKEVHSKGSTSFKESLKRASASWKKKKGSKPTTQEAAPKKRRRKKKAEEPASIAEPAAPKKKHRRKAKRAMPKLPAAVYKSVDSRNL